jgi:hypothetical protein
MEFAPGGCAYHSFSPASDDFQRLLYPNASCQRDLGEYHTVSAERNHADRQTARVNPEGASVSSNGAWRNWWS